MIEQSSNKLILTFPTVDSATIFANFLQSLLTVTASPLRSPDSQPSPPAPAISSPPSGSSPELPSPDFPELARSRRTVLTEERQEALFNQRQAGMSASQRLLRAQATLRDGVLPFSKPGETPRSSGQLSPRIKAQQEGTFADGLPQAAALWPKADGGPKARPKADGGPKARPKADGDGLPEARTSRLRIRPAQPSPRP
jgi:hypothetical protein